MNSVTTVVSESDSILLKKGANGKFVYEIKCYGKDIDEIMTKIDKAKQDLDMKYGDE